MMQNTVEIPKKPAGRWKVLSAEDEVSVARRYYVDGASATAIAEEFAEFSATGKLSASTVRRIAKRAFARMDPESQRIATSPDLRFGGPRNPDGSPAPTSRNEKDTHYGRRATDKRPA